MHIHLLSKAAAAIWFYNAYIPKHEAKQGDLAGSPTSDELARGYA